jgi:hypothetical protein
MLLRTVAPWPSGCDSARTFLTTTLGFWNAETTASELEDDDDMVRAAGRRKKAVGIRKKTSRRIGRSLVVMVLVLFCSCEVRRWVPVLILV